MRLLGTAVCCVRDLLCIWLSVPCLPGGYPAQLGSSYNMGKARLQVYSSDSSSDELSSGEESYTIDYGRYQAACLAEGLQSR